MPNVNSPFGLMPIQDDGTPFNGQGRLVYFPASQAGNIFRGDPIVALGGSDAYGVPSYGIATAGASNLVGGVFIGPSNGPAAGANATSALTRDLPTYRQASIANYGLMLEDPNMLFAIQEDSVGGALTNASANLNANLVSGAGSTYSGASGWMLQSSSAATTATLQLRILGLHRAPDNAIGNYARWIVRLNLPQLWGATGA